MAQATRSSLGAQGSHATILGVCSGLGQLRPGPERAPDAIRRAGLANVLREHDIEIDDHGDLTTQGLRADPLPNRGLRNADAVLEICRRHAERLAPVLDRSTHAITLGGDHSVSLGTWTALQAAGRNKGLLWVDAHGDFNTAQTSPSGNIHGMVLAQILGIGDERFTGLGESGPKARPEDTVLLGVRCLDRGERRLLDDSGVTCLAMSEIDRVGIARVADRALDVLTRGGQEFHVSFDVDVLDPLEAPGTGTPVFGGLRFREARVLMETIGQSGLLGSLDLTEINPLLDEADRTSRVAAALLAAALHGGS